MNHTCKNCNQKSLKFFPVEVNTKKKRCGDFTLSIFILSIIAILICGIILLSTADEYFKALSGYDDTLSAIANATAQTVTLILSWPRIIKAIKVLAIIASVALAVHLVLPYKRTVTTVAVCQKCAALFEIDELTDDETTSE